MSNTQHRILVIEDEAEIRELFREVLTAEGHLVTAVEDGLAGLQAAVAEPPDCIVTDLLTPRMHGYEVIRRLRAQDRTRRTPIIVVSGKAYAADQRKAMEMGANAYLMKPFRAAALARLVDKVLNTVRVRFWGVRGSIAAPGPETVKYGGNTPCVTIERGRDILVLDAGTGLRKLGLTLNGEAAGKPLHVRMLITHTHWDHIQGFPFFVPAFVPGNIVEVHGPPSTDKPLERVLKGQMDPEYFPVALGDMAADVRVHEIREPEFQVGPFHVQSRYVNHPGVTMAFRITLDDTVITYATDTEPYRTLLGGPDTPEEITQYGTKRDQDLVAFAKDADLYIADAQYSPQDYQTKRGWGHTCYTDAVDIAMEADARRLCLFSHDPMHDDDAVDRKLAHCQRIASERGSDLEITAATEGETIELVESRTVERSIAPSKAGADGD